MKKVIFFLGSLVWVRICHAQQTLGILSTQFANAPRESSDGHIWKNWRIYLTEFLPQLFK